MLRWNCSTSMGILNERELIAAVETVARGGILGASEPSARNLLMASGLRTR